jgi:hypothetical protein
MITKKELYKIIECAVEFTLQTDVNSNIPRAEFRHKIADAVLEFLETNKKIPEDDIDEFIANFLKKYKS